MLADLAAGEKGWSDNFELLLVVSQEGLFQGGEGMAKIL